MLLGHIYLVKHLSPCFPRRHVPKAYRSNNVYYTQLYCTCESTQIKKHTTNSTIITCCNRVKKTRSSCCRWCGVTRKDESVSFPSRTECVWRCPELVVVFTSSVTWTYWRRPARRGAALRLPCKRQRGSDQPCRSGQLH